MSDALTSATALRERLELAFEHHDRPAAIVAALSAVESGEVDLRTLYHDILAPMMHEVGARWQSGRTRVWEEHLISNAVRGIVEALYPRVQAMKSAATPSGHSIVLACPEDEAHDLGLRMVADMFEVAGWTTYLLGADTPTHQIAEAAGVLGVDHVLLSVTTLVDRVQIRGVLDQLHARLPGVRVVVIGCEADCEERGLKPQEIFRPGEFFGPLAEKPASNPAMEE